MTLKSEFDRNCLIFLLFQYFSEYDIEDRSFIFVEKDPSCERSIIPENVPVPSLNLTVKKSGWKALESPEVPDEVRGRAGWIKHSAMDRSNSRFTSYVDLDSMDGGEVELEMKPTLLEGEMMITQADKVCLYSSQPGG